MNDSMTELENIITLNLQSANNLKNEVEKKENEKQNFYVQYYFQNYSQISSRRW